MKDREKQLEEILSIAKIVDKKCNYIKCKNCNILDNYTDEQLKGLYCSEVKIAENIYNADYRKIDKDSVVLSKEEWRKYVDNENEAYYRGQHETEVYYKNIQIPKERKETAEKIYTKLKDSFLINSDNRYALKLWIEEQFNIKIKD